MGARVHTFVAMGTTVTFRAPRAAVDRVGATGTEEAFTRAAAWFREVERVCNRFDTGSELCRLSSRIGLVTRVSTLLCQAVAFAISLAERTDGAFDPTVGKKMESRGFATSYLTGETVQVPVEAENSVTYRDVRVDPEAGTICLERPLLLDLGAIAKGLAIDLAARELAELGSFAIDAGGDLWLEGLDDADAPWTVGIRDPRGGLEPIETFQTTGAAVCTSGDYERKGIDGQPHIIEPRSPSGRIRVASATVIAPSAIVADGLGTSAAVMGPELGIRLLEREGVAGVIYSSEMRRFATESMAGLSSRISPHAATSTARV